MQCLFVTHTVSPGLKPYWDRRISFKSVISCGRFFYFLLWCEQFSTGFRCISCWECYCMHLNMANWLYTHTHIYREGYLMVFFLNPPSDDRPTGLLSNVSAHSKWTNAVCIHLAVHFIPEQVTINNNHIPNRLLLTFITFRIYIEDVIPGFYDPCLW